MTHEVDYGNDVVRLHIPRRCLDGPRWVRVVDVSMWHEGGTTFSDNPLDHDAVPGRLSGRVYAG